jgi:hypothetical protein
MPSGITPTARSSFMVDATTAPITEPRITTPARLEACIVL